MRGVQSRLFGGVLTALLTLGCIAFVLTASSITMGVTFAFTIGTYSLAASIALLMSARQEELIHQISHNKHDQQFLEQQPHHPPQNFVAHENPIHEPSHRQFCTGANYLNKKIEPNTSGHNATDGRL